METPPPLWETSAWSPSQWKTVSWRSEETSCVSVCACYLLCCHWTPWKPGSVFFVLPNSGYFYTSVRASLSFLSFGLSSLSSLDLFSPETSPSAAQDAVGCLCCKGTLLVHGHLLVHQDPKLPLSQAAFYLLSPRLTNMICKCLKMKSPLKWVPA